MNIGGRDIGKGHPTFLVAEIGVNHDGSVDRALELVALAGDAGADAVKLQVFRADTLVHPSATFAQYQKDRVTAADPADMLRQYELDDAALRVIANAAASAGLQVISTPFSPDDVPRAAGVSAAIKIASPDLVNRLLLRHALATGLPLIVSTGAATAAEIDAAVRWIGGETRDFALLHCVSSYPVAEADAHLAWIGDLRRHGVAVGYSDHTTDVAAGALAVAAGASIIEKHLTYDTAAAGPDHAASFSRDAFAEYVRRIRQADRMMGAPGRVVLACEEDVRTVSRQSLVLRRALRAGETITAADLTTQRPGTGISAVSVDEIVGRRTLRALPATHLLTAADVAGPIDGA